MLSSQDPAQVVRYARPAADWLTEALPIGNGFMGAMFGVVVSGNLL